MRIAFLLFFLFLSANTAIAADTPHLRVIRSLVAEAALYIQLEREHKVSATYAEEMRQLTRQNLLSERQGSGSVKASRFADVALKALAAADERALLQVDSKLTEMLGS